MSGMLYILFSSSCCVREHQPCSRNSCRFEYDVNRSRSVRVELVRDPVVQRLISFQLDAVLGWISQRFRRSEHGKLLVRIGEYSPADNRHCLPSENWSSTKWDQGVVLGRVLVLRIRRWTSPGKLHYTYSAVTWTRGTIPFVLRSIACTCSTRSSSFS